MSTFLRRALALDAVATGATALLLLAGGGLLAAPLGLPEGLLRGAGLFLVPFVALVGWSASRAVPPRPVVRAIIALNVAWVIASLALLVTGRVAPSALGIAFVIAQALAVGVFAELQILGLRRTRAPA